MISIYLASSFCPHLVEGCIGGGEDRQLSRLSESLHEVGGLDSGEKCTELRVGTQQVGHSLG